MVGNQQSGRLPYHPAEKLAYGRRLLDIRDMAELLKVSTSTVRRWWAKGAIPRPLQAGGSGLGVPCAGIRHGSRRLLPSS